MSADSFKEQADEWSRNLMEAAGVDVPVIEYIASQVEWRREISANLNLLGDIALGTRTSEFQGGGVRQHDGIVHSLDRIERRQADIDQKLDNGAMRPKIELTRRQKVLMWVGGLIVTVGMPFLAASLVS